MANEWVIWTGNALLFLIIGVIAGVFIYSGMNPSEEPVMEEHVHTETLEITGEIPSVEIEVLQDAKSGYNVHIMTENFVFAPEHASTEHIEGEGHAHIYVDGVKISRVYGNWFHLDNIPVGVHEIRVTLNANSHEDLTANGKKLQDTVLLDISETGSHTHDAMDEH